MQLMIITRTLNCMSITQDGYTPLIHAAYRGKCDVVLDLLDSGADVNAQSNVSHCHHLRLELFHADIPGYVQYPTKKVFGIHIAIALPYYCLVTPAFNTCRSSVYAENELLHMIT